MRRGRGAPSLIRGASPLGLPDTLSRTPLRRRAPFAWLAHTARSHPAAADHFCPRDAQNVTLPPRRLRQLARHFTAPRGIAIAIVRGVIVRHPLTRSLILLLPLTVCAARLHRSAASPPRAVTQEINCCLSLARVAASSRRNRAGRGYDVTGGPRRGYVLTTKSNVAARPAPESCTAISSASL